MEYKAEFLTTFSSISSTVCPSFVLLASLISLASFKTESESSELFPGSLPLDFWNSRMARIARWSYSDLPKNLKSGSMSIPSADDAVGLCRDYFRLWYDTFLGTLTFSMSPYLEY